MDLTFYTPSALDKQQLNPASGDVGRLRAFMRRRPVLSRGIILAFASIVVLAVVVVLNIRSMTSMEFSPTSVTLTDNGRFLSLNIEGVERNSGGNLPFLAGAVLRHPR